MFIKSKFSYQDAHSRTKRSKMKETYQESFIYIRRDTDWFKSLLKVKENSET